HEHSPYMGLNVFTGDVIDMKVGGGIEPKRVKKQAIQSAAEAAEMILRIDDIIASSSSGKPSPEEMAAAGMGGAGGMPPMM
ncbi:MAG: thermosome subunit, partial [Methanobacterium paludis]|nr:thermosome subunit [Methanobacterium paludis]